MGRCIYCNQPAGFLKDYHESCHQQMNLLKNEILQTLEAYESKKISYSSAQEKVSALLDKKNKLQEASLIRPWSHELMPNEEVVYEIRCTQLMESKNTCKMTRTGLSYEKYPIWNVTEHCLDYGSTYYLTNFRIILDITDKGYMKFPFKKIVNCGNLSNGGCYPFFDVATTSPYPHRFTIHMKEEVGERKLVGKLMNFLIDGDIHRNKSADVKTTKATYSNNKPKHKWLYEEDKLCCKVVIEEYVLRKSNKNLEDVLETLSYKMPDIGRNSLRMKIQNIKQLLKEAGIDNTLNTKALYSYSAQNKRAFEDVIRESGLE